VGAPRRARTGHPVARLAFWTSLLFKTLDGTLEIVGGIWLSLVASNRLSHWAAFLTKHDLDGDADDVIVRSLVHVLPPMSHAGSHEFAIVFLIGHGLVKLCVVAALVRQIRGGYWAACGIFGVFVVYQLYRFTLTHSLGLLALTATDLLVIWVLWLDYRRLGERRLCERCATQISSSAQTG
jgi:uncharacterized membrane protein